MHSPRRKRTRSTSKLMSLSAYVKHISEDRALVAITLCALAYFFAFSSMSIMRYNAFLAANDLGIFNHKLYNTLHGRFYLSAEGGEEHYQHMDYLILAFAPIYAAAPYPETLLAIQSAFLASGAVFIYLLARRKLGPKAGLAISASYLLYPALHYVNLYDYHSIALAGPLIIAAFYCFQERKRKSWIVLFTLAMLAEETVPVFIVLSGIYLWTTTRRREAAFLAVYALAWSFVFLAVLLPSEMVAGQTLFEIYQSRYSHLGQTQTEMMWNVMSDPIAAFTYGGGASRARFIFDLLAPGGFVALADPAILIASPQFAAAFLSKYEWMRTIHWQSYSAIIIPFVFISLVYGIARLSRLSRRGISTHLSIAVLALTAASFFALGIGNPNTAQWISENASPDTQLLATTALLMRTIPENSTVAAPGHIFPHMWGKKMIYRLQDNFNEMVYDENYTRLPDYVIIDYNPKHYQEKVPEAQLTGLLGRRGYTVALNRSTVFLYRLDPSA